MSKRDKEFSQQKVEEKYIYIYIYLTSHHINIPIDVCLYDEQLLKTSLDTAPAEESAKMYKYDLLS